MNRENFILLILAILLLIGMALTLYGGKGRSRHGYGAQLPSPWGIPAYGIPFSTG